MIRNNKALIAFQIADRRYQRAIGEFDLCDTDDIPDEIFVLAERAMEDVVARGNELIAANLFTLDVQADVRSKLAEVERDLGVVKRAEGRLH